MKTYKCDDGNAEIEIEASSPREAAEDYVAGGEWGQDNTKTFWVNVYVWTDETDRETHKVAVHPELPSCDPPSRNHQFEAVKRWGNGGGVVSKSVCEVCGLVEYEDTWAQDPQDGQQGLTSYEYTREDE